MVNIGGASDFAAPRQDQHSAVLSISAKFKNHEAPTAPTAKWRPWDHPRTPRGRPGGKSAHFYRKFMVTQR